MAKARPKARKSHVCRPGAKERRGQVGDRQRVASRGPKIGGMEDEDRDQHEQAAEHGEEDELHRRVDAPAAAPDADEEVHRDEHGLPEDIEEEEIQRDEDADHAGLEQEHEDGELLDPVADGPPGREQGQRRQERGQKDEEQADAVDADMIIEAASEPGGPLDEFGQARCPAEAEIQRQRQAESQERHGQGHRPHELDRAAAEEDEKDGSRERQKGDDGDERESGG